MKPSLSVAWLAVLALAAASASAQTVYRCGNEYTRVPCTEGKSIDTDDRATSTKRAEEARHFAAREKQLADDMARDRRAREAAQRPALAASLGPSKPHTEPAPAIKPKKTVKGKAKPRAVDDGQFVAAVPKAKKVARN
ncbi:MAG: hypothetical protein ABJA61_07350 [Caldimonas sp.]